MTAVVLYAALLAVCWWLLRTPTVNADGYATRHDPDLSTTGVTPSGDLIGPLTLHRARAR